MKPYTIKIVYATILLYIYLIYFLHIFSIVCVSTAVFKKGNTGPHSRARSSRHTLFVCLHVLETFKDKVISIKTHSQLFLEATNHLPINSILKLINNVSSFIRLSIKP